MVTVREVEDEIFTVEGFKVRICRDGKKVRSDHGGLEQYRFSKAGYGTWTVSDWKENRFFKYYTEFDIEVLTSNGSCAHGNRNLAKLRAGYTTQTKNTVVSPSAVKVPPKVNTVVKNRIEKEFWPTLTKDNPSSIPSLEIAVDYVPDEYSNEIIDLLLHTTQEWVDKVSFKGKAVIWQWFCPDSSDFVHFGGYVGAEFICMIGLPADCRQFVAARLENVFGNAFKFPADALSSEELSVARSCAYVDEGIVWEPLDACSWITVKEFEVAVEVKG